MARTQFGGNFASWVVQVIPADSLQTGAFAVVLPTAAIPLELHIGTTDGPIANDFLIEGIPTTEIVIAVNNPYIPMFEGPDGVDTLWVLADGPAGSQWLKVPHFEESTGGTDGGAVQLSGDNVVELATSVSDGEPFMTYRIPNDGSDSNTWPNRWVYEYFDNSTSQYRAGAYINEKGLHRVRGVTPSDVPSRVMAHPNHNSNTAISEVTLDNNTLKLFQVFINLILCSVPIQMPYIVNPLGERLYWGTGDPNTHPAYSSFRPNANSGWADYNA